MKGDVELNCHYLSCHREKDFICSTDISNRDQVLYCYLRRGLCIEKEEMKDFYHILLS